MYPLSQGLVLIMTFGHLCLAPSVGRDAYHSGRLVNPAAALSEGTSRWVQEAPLGLAGKRTGNPDDQHRGGVLLAKAPKKRKG